MLLPPWAAVTLLPSWCMLLQHCCQPLPCLVMVTNLFGASYSTCQVCYYGRHYHCFAFNADLQKWILFDDATVKVRASSGGTGQGGCKAARVSPVLAWARGRNSVSVVLVAALSFWSPRMVCFLHTLPFRLLVVGMMSSRRARRVGCSHKCCCMKWEKDCEGDEERK